VPVPPAVNDFYQMTVSYRAALSVVAEFYSIRRFRDASHSELVAATELLDGRSVYFVTGINVKVDLFYSMFFYLMDTFAPKRLVRVDDDICGVCIWLMTVLSLRSGK
jgi:hypothetical protein